MTRIIAGFAGSLILQTPRVGTRPTSDRVREAIFSALDARGVLDGAQVVDLYAGTGALGLEAASRGAARVILVEKSSAAATVCRANAKLVLGRAAASADLKIEVSSQPVQAFLTASAETWDVAFLDPPYDLDEAELLLALEALAPRLETDATLCLERSSRSPEPEWPAGLRLDRRKHYGDTTLWWATAG